MRSENVTKFLETLDRLCVEKANAEIAAGQKAYMRDQFAFYGIKTPVRKEIQKVLFQKDLLPSKDDLPTLVRILWEKAERENQYIGQELARKYIRKAEAKDWEVYEYMITHKSWWDTVDFIASNLVGPYFQQYPHKRDEVTSSWMESGNMWLQRTVLLFQLKYKDALDTDFLADTIHSLTGSEEFFINKAIGWILREYSKTNPQWVRQFVQATSLHPLSKREGMRLII